MLEQTVITKGKENELNLNGYYYNLLTLSKIPCF